LNQSTVVCLQNRQFQAHQVRPQLLVPHHQVALQRKVGFLLLVLLTLFIWLLATCYSYPVSCSCLC
jgi:hypothetical protein